MSVQGFDESFLKNHPRYKREDGWLTALVEPLCGTWGYTLWDRNTCVGGAKDWNWGRDEALTHAIKAFDSLVASRQVTEIHRDQDRYR